MGIFVISKFAQDSEPDRLLGLSNKQGIVSKMSN